MAVRLLASLQDISKYSCILAENDELRCKLCMCSISQAKRSKIDRHIASEKHKRMTLERKCLDQQRLIAELTSPEKNALNQDRLINDMERIKDDIFKLGKTMEQLNGTVQTGFQTLQQNIQRSPKAADFGFQCSQIDEHQSFDQCQSWINSDGTYGNYIQSRSQSPVKKNFINSDTTKTSLSQRNSVSDCSNTSLWQQRLQYKYAKSHNTRDAYKSHINMFVKWLEKQQIPDEAVTEDTVNDYLLTTIINTGSSVSKLKNAVAALNFKYYTVEKRFKISRPTYRTPVKAKRPHMAYSKQEIQTLLKAIGNEKIKLTCLLLYQMAGRMQDVAEFKLQFIRGPHPKVKGKYIVDLPPLKTEKERVVMINQTAYDLLQKHCKDGCLFNKSTEAVAEQLRRYFTCNFANFANKGNIQTHNFRVSKATHLSRKGVAIQQIMEYLGHTNINTTQLYLKSIQASDDLIDMVSSGDDDSKLEEEKVNKRKQNHNKNQKQQKPTIKDIAINHESNKILQKRKQIQDIIDDNVIPTKRQQKKQ